MNLPLLEVCQSVRQTGKKTQTLALIVFGDQFTDSVNVSVNNRFKPFDAHCYHMGTAINHPVPDLAKPSFVIFDIWALCCMIECD